MPARTHRTASLVFAAVVVSPAAARSVRSSGTVSVSGGVQGSLFEDGVFSSPRFFSIAAEASRTGDSTVDVAVAVRAADVRGGAVFRPDVHGGGGLSLRPDGPDAVALGGALSLDLATPLSSPSDPALRWSTPPARPTRPRRRVG